MRRSLLSSEHDYFAAIYTQETFTEGGKEMSLRGGRRRGWGAVAPPVIQVGKGPDRLSETLKLNKLKYQTVSLVF